MRTAYVIAKREITSFFASPLAWVVLTVWITLCGGYFTLLCFLSASQPMPSTGSGETLIAQFFGTVIFYMFVLVFVPLLTMRLLAEESRSGTLETLLTAPVSEVSVVFGKYAAAIVYWVAMWIPTLMYVWLTSRFGDVDLGAVAATYFGLFTLGLSWMAVGLLMSAIGKHQLIAALLTFLALGGHFLIGLGTFVVSEDSTREVLEYVSVWGHIQSYARGIVDTRCITWDLTVTVFALFAAIGVLEWRRYEA
jgi:ABC-2 type transport system permease protein